MKKHAYLIIVHNNFYILEKLLTLLDSDNNDFYIHIDKKVKDFDFNYYENITKKSNTIFLSDKERINVYWGNYSLVQCELNLLKKMLDYGTEYSYVHLISGVDLPIKSKEEIYNYFESNYGKEFVTYEEPWPQDRVKYNYIFTKTYRHKNKNIQRIGYLARTIYIFLQKKLKFDHTKKYTNYTFKKGSQWFSITYDCAKFIYSKKNEINNMFKNQLYPDEHFIQTILYNSKYKTKVTGDTAKRYIDWKRGQPYTFKNYDFEELLQSDNMFARKFDENVDKNIIDKIYNVFIND